MEHYSGIKKEQNFAICSNIDGLRGVKMQRKTNAVGYCLYVESKKYNKLVNIPRKRRDSQMQKTNVVISGEGWEGRYRVGKGGTN